MLVELIRLISLIRTLPLKLNINKDTVRCGMLSMEVQDHCRNKLLKP